VRTTTAEHAKTAMPESDHRPLESSYLPIRWPNTRFHPTPLRVDKIAAILASRCTQAISRSIRAARVKRNPLGGWGSVVGNPVSVICVGLVCERSSCQARRASARCAGVVGMLVVRYARCAQRDRVLGVVQIEARCASVIACQCGAVMPGAAERR
jgi:hypothetical protein